jgi:hypothetical protein
VNRELEKKAEADANALRAIKERSISDIAALGTPVGRLTDGDAFGEQSFITKTPAMATVRTVEYCELVSLTRADLECVSEAYPRLRSEVDAFVEGRKARYSEHNRKIVKNLDGTGTQVAQRRRRDSLLLRAIRPGSLHPGRNSQITADLKAQDELRAMRAQCYGSAGSTRPGPTRSIASATNTKLFARGSNGGGKGSDKGKNNDGHTGRRSSSSSSSSSTIAHRHTIDELLNQSQNPRLSSAELQMTA